MIAFALAAAIGGGTWFVTRDVASPRSLPVAAPPAVTPDAPPQAPEAPTVAHTTAPEPAPDPVRAPAPKKVGRSKPAAETESQLLERAYRALDQPVSALAITAEHHRGYPDGVLEQEREVIAIDALLWLDRRPEAEARAERFFGKFMGTAHAERIRARLDQKN